jgi:hypothetical protein
MIQKKATQVLIRKSGFNQCTANAVKFGPPRLGAIGFRYLFTEQSLLQQWMLAKHLRTPGQPQHLYLICLSWAQLLCGLGLLLLEFPDLAAPTLEDAFSSPSELTWSTPARLYGCIYLWFARPLEQTIFILWRDSNLSRN